MKVALCCIGRLENQYAVEFVEWYKKLGFDKIFIYDNNHDGEEYFEDVLQSYIDDGFVEIINYRNLQAAQLMAYNNCYQNHGNEYDWIAFFDFDEFLTLVEDKDIKSYLDNFKWVDCIKINWMTYTDNGLVINDHRPLLERFTTPMEYDKSVNYSSPENNHVKSIIRGRLGNFKWFGTPHVPCNGLKYCNSIGEEVDGHFLQPYNFHKAYIKHFSLKTIDEYLNNKKIRGQADRLYSSFIKRFDINYFFKINERTEEKIRYIKKYIK